MKKCAKCDSPRYSTTGYCFEHYAADRIARQEAHRVQRAAAGNPVRPYPKRRKHGCTNKPWFRTYEAMIRRASGKHEARCYAHVDVCREWLDDPRAFGEWAESNGFKPGLTIDRIDPRAGYRPENCRWIALSENVKHSHETSPRRHGADGRFSGRST